MLRFWEEMIGKKNLEDIDNYRQLKCFHKKLLKEIFPQKTYSDDFEEYLKEINFEKYFKKLTRYSVPFPPKRRLSFKMAILLSLVNFGISHNENWVKHTKNIWQCSTHL